MSEQDFSMHDQGFTAIEPQLSAADEQAVSQMLALAGPATMPDSVFAAISRALSIEVELRREGIDPDDSTGTVEQSLAPGLDKEIDPVADDGPAPVSDAELEALCLDGDDEPDLEV